MVWTQFGNAGHPVDDLPVQTSDHCTSNCGTSTCNTVTITDNIAGDGLLSVTVTLASGGSSSDTISKGHEATFAFSSSPEQPDLPDVQRGFTEFGPVGAYRTTG